MTARDLLLLLAAGCTAGAVALVTVPAAGLAVLAALLVGLWWLTQEVDDGEPT